jgi:hypothetical protein
MTITPQDTNYRRSTDTRILNSGQQILPIFLAQRHQNLINPKQVAWWNPFISQLVTEFSHYLLPYANQGVREVPLSQYQPSLQFAGQSASNEPGCLRRQHGLHGSPYALNEPSPPQHHRQR